MINNIFPHPANSASAFDRIQAGMDSDTTDPTMAPDEMYLMLQADMISIKRQEEVLQSEIDDIASKFHSLLESCGLTAESDAGIMAPPTTPSFMKTASLTHVTNIENLGTPSFLMLPARRTIYVSSEDETMDLIPAPFCSLAESEVTSSDGCHHDMSSKTLIMDSNSNYINSPTHSEVTDNTPIIEALPDLEVSPSSTSTTSSTSTGSSGNMASSDGYPKSDDSSDNQIVPECYDLDKEFMSRLQYYSDFTIDRQKKINSMVSHLTNSTTANNNSVFTEELFTRHVEGAETPASPVKVTNKLRSSSKSGSGSDYRSTPNSRHRSNRDRHNRKSRSCRKSMSNPLASSTMLDFSFSSSSSGRVSSRGSSNLIPQASSTVISSSPSSSTSGKRNRTNGSNPRACSTLLDESFLSSGSAGSHGSRHRSSSIPMASSTMIIDSTAIVPGELSSVRCDSKNNIMNSDDDCASIYTWSIHDSDAGSDRVVNLEESYMRNVTHSTKKKGLRGKPPLPPVKRTRSGSISSSSSEKLCRDQNLHKLLGEPCSKHLENISVIECNSMGRDGALLVESMFEDNECAIQKSNTLPRSSTKFKLVQDKSSGSSSMEAKRASLPDLSSVSTTVDDFHSVPESLESVSDDDNDISALPERLQCAGKSSSSNDKDSNNDVSGLDVSTMMQSPSGGELIDSILTDSPNSVCSSGINAPSNSPATNCSSSSKVSRSTTSDARSSGSNINAKAPAVPFLRRNGNIPYSPKVQNTDVPQSTQNDNNVFKIPKQNQPLRNLFRFRRNKCKTPDHQNVQTSTPKSTAASVVSDLSSKRELFPTPSATAQHEPRLMDKKAVIKKFKRFSDNFHKRDKSGRGKIETLANL